MTTHHTSRIAEENNIFWDQQLEAYDDSDAAASDAVEKSAEQQIDYKFGPLIMTPRKFGPFTFDDDSKIDEELLAGLCSQMNASVLDCSTEQKQNIFLVAVVDAAVDEYHRQNNVALVNKQCS